MKIKTILTSTRLSVLSPFVSNFTIYLTRILVWRPINALTLSVYAEEPKNEERKKEKKNESMKHNIEYERKAEYILLSLWRKSVL